MNIFSSLVCKEIRLQLQWIGFAPYFCGGCKLPESWLPDFELDTFTVATEMDANIILN